MNRVRQTLTVAATLIATAGFGQEIELVTTDGLLTVRGQLVDFDGVTYTIDSRLGRMRFPADEMNCIGDACPAINQVTSTFVVAASPTVQQVLMPELVDAYSLTVDTDIDRTEAATGAVLFQLQTFEGDSVVDIELVERGASEALESLAGGDATLALTNRPATDAEAAALTGRDRRAMERLGLEHVLAFDAVAVTVGAQVGLDAIATQDLLRVLSGSISNWSEIGGPDLPVSVFARDRGTVSRDLLDAKLLGPASVTLSPSAILVDNDDSVAIAVRTFPNSIGVLELDRLGDLEPVSIFDRCGVPVRPTSLSIKTEQYPLSSPLFVYNAVEDVTVHARALIDFAQSAEGQEVLRTAGFVDLVPESGAATPSPAIADYVDGAMRMSMTFHAVEEGEDVDPLDRINLSNLVGYVRAGLASGREIILVGRGADEASGRAAARQVLDRIFELGPDIEEQLSVSFRLVGAPLPSGCAPDEAPAVQIWVRPLADG